ncbi:hypothetical protein CMO96_03730 [Candidatus Woesebacteria bacterium]|nr:hypothetical protein [Candidatus Woesebacteria bacterium]|tara:strand:- start:233 stop:736 length:504 start_codon:yes stop_codon:yes gene_type:complete
MAKNGKMTFFSPTKGELPLNRVTDEITNFVGEDSHSTYRLVIGTDSQAKRLNGVAEIDFVTAIVIHRQGSGGRYFWRKKREKKTYVLREKIYTETLISLNFAQKFIPALRGKLPASKYDLEIHVDVGPVGPTRDMIKEVVGMVNGNGYVAKTKPEAYGAFVVADKHT